MKTHCGTKNMVKAYWIIIARLALCVLLLTACHPTGLNLPQSPLLRSLERKAGLIAYVSPEGNIYTADQAGGKIHALTADARSNNGSTTLYQSPTWSPDSRRLAFVGFNFDENGLSRASVYMANTDGSGLEEAFSSSAELPFYMHWSPDGKMLTFLSADLQQGQVTLRLIPTSGGEARKLLSGNSIYWHWAPDNQSIMLHLNGAARMEPSARLSLLNIGDELQTTFSNLRPVFFQSPAWSPSGDRLLLAGEIETGEDALFITDRNGKVQDTLEKIEGYISFGWSPNGKKLAYLIRNLPLAELTHRTLTIVDPGKPEHTLRIDEQDILAFFWSPDSRSLAYFILTPALSADPEDTTGQIEAPKRLTLFVLDIETGKKTEVVTFLPTDQFMSVLPFFDQYAHSASLWSPDSRNLVLSVIDSDGDPAVFVVEAAGNLKPRYLAPGIIAFWSWK
jgi:TolB protein